MAAKRRIKFVCIVVLYWDKRCGNTYHSVYIVRTSDARTLAVPFQYGNRDRARDVALGTMAKAKWLPPAYRQHPDQWRYERENNYPILWTESIGSKLECARNGQL